MNWKGITNMSLDAFATTIATSRINDSVQITDDLYKIFDLDENGFFIFNPKLSENEGDFAYWRNFYHLQDWMEQLFYQKGGSDENDFNDEYVRLTLADLDNLWNEANLDKLDGLDKIFSEKFKQSLTPAEQIEANIFISNPIIQNQPNNSDYNISKENMEKLKQFIIDAKKYIQSNPSLAIFYYSSW